MRRETTSLPRSSVPRMCWAEGSAYRSNRFWSSNPYGMTGQPVQAIRSARSAMSAKTPMTTMPKTAKRCLRRRLQTARHCPISSDSMRSASRAGRSSAAAEVISLVAYARVDDGVQHVGEQIRRDDQEGDEGQDAHGYGDVVPQHGVEVQLSHARVVEDRLGDDRAREDVRDVQADDRDDRDQGVAQRVLHEHEALGHALGARRAQEILSQHLEHAGAHEAAP